MFSVGRALVFRFLKRFITIKFPDIQWISTKKLAHWLEDPAQLKPLLLDARTEAEYAVSHLKAAQRIDPRVPELAALKEIAFDQPIIVYCSVGYRSAGVAQKLQKAGFNRVYNLEGSIFKWANENRPIFKEGLPAQLVHPYDAFWGKLVECRCRAAIDC
ncbi:rhodanese-like domain-containing protein [Microcoleus sp. FACHB-672]|uniref:rhodanese-like domain-containing protein n=1 Tax=Microcoleus sp. FACHB-672 TaxID=2692825 RepID=UPI001683AEB9|nr:rhodanese-like domain-containing protein [Microcoleus sp. FACHB-672]MBD2039735.1 rhodanese-like domain-containing protein [Microcoleus sp. FACHB-672]